MRMKKKKGSFHGRKERLRNEVVALKADKKDWLLKISKISYENERLQKYELVAMLYTPLQAMKENLWGQEVKVVASNKFHICYMCVHARTFFTA